MHPESINIFHHNLLCLTAKCYLSLGIITEKNVLQLLKTFPNEEKC